MIKNRLYVKTVNGIIFDLDLRGRIVLIDGNSGTGKTFLLNTIKNNQLNPVSLRDNLESDLSDVVTIDVFTKDRINNIKNMSNKLIIIDNADIILNQDMANFISLDKNNQYLIYSRGKNDFHISPNYYAYLERNCKKISLNYRFSEEGWF